jgi:hypothetical protein
LYVARRVDGEGSSKAVVDMRSIPWPLIFLLVLIVEAVAALLWIPHDNWFATVPGAQTTFADDIASSSQTVKIVIDALAVTAGVIAITYLALIWEIGRRNYQILHPHRDAVRSAPVSGLLRPSPRPMLPDGAY